MMKSGLYLASASFIRKSHTPTVSNQAAIAAYVNQCMKTDDAAVPDSSAYQVCLNVVVGTPSSLNEVKCTHAIVTITHTSAINNICSPRSSRAHDRRRWRTKQPKQRDE